MEGKVCINNKIDHVVSCINIVTIAEPIDTIISRQHCVKHEILKVGQVLRREEFCFVHDCIMAQNRAKIKRSCATLPTGFFTLLSTHICLPLNDIFGILIRSRQSDKLLRLSYT